ncbi:MAG: flagellar type III secretion system pore protein FliP [Gemmatimonadaceae bacterium]
MVTAGLSVVAALAFVLGLGAVCLWALKRWGAGPLRPRTRVAVEVVQRVPLGPKTGLAVVRVGDKVMAVSVGDGGVRPLFELDEADRQRVIATSHVPLPVPSSSEAAAAFAPLSPMAFGTTFGGLLSRSLGTVRPASPPLASTADAVAPVTEAPVTDAPVTDAPVTLAAPATTPLAPAPMPSQTVTAIPPLSLTEAAEVPSFLTAPLTTSRGAAVTYGPLARARRSAGPVAPHGADRDFRSLLGVSLSGATRLAVLAGAMLLIGSPSLHAQGTGTGTGPAVGAPPVVQPPAAPAVQPPASPVLSPPVAPVPPAAPQRPVPAAGAPNASAMRTARPATPGTATQAPAPRPGNGAQLNTQGTATRRETNRMQLDSMARANQNAQAAAAAPIAADDAIMRMMPQMDVKLGGNGEGEGLRLNGTVGIVVMMGLLTLLPTLLLMMTGFTRILIVLHFLKQAMGTQSAPPGQLLAGMALLLTGFVMGPTLSEVNRTAITPWLDGKITQVEMMKTGVQPMRTFMLRQTREADLKAFVEMSRMPRPATVDDVPLHVLMSAFVASELRTAFQIGFAIYLPFIIIDAVVASVLMSMGMMMLPPAMISLPFKLLLFVLVDGWSLTITSLVQSFK